MFYVFGIQTSALNKRNLKQHLMAIYSINPTNGLSVQLILIERLMK